MVSCKKRDPFLDPWRLRVFTFSALFFDVFFNSFLDYLFMCSGAKRGFPGGPFFAKFNIISLIFRKSTFWNYASRLRKTIHLASRGAFWDFGIDFSLIREVPFSRRVRDAKKSKNRPRFGCLFGFVHKKNSPRRKDLTKEENCFGAHRFLWVVAGGL